MAGKIQATVFGFDKQKAVRTAVKRIITNVESQKCNCLEITGVMISSFLGMPYACVSAHSRHVQGSPVCGAKIARYFDTSAVAQAVAGTYGTLGRNILRGPGFDNTDLSVSRAFPLHFREGAKLLFRTEFFNLFNRPQLGQPNATIGNRTFGRITSTASSPRILQLSLKVEF